MKKRAENVMSGGQVAGARYSRALLEPSLMGAADRAAIESGVPGATLMEAAGRAVAAEILSRWPLPDAPVAILCGPGNNGGDGYVIASVLKEAGWPVTVYALAPAATGTDAEWAARRWVDVGDILPLDEAACDAIASAAPMAVDALFGAGLSRPFEGRAATLSRRLSDRCARIAAVDTPSGLCGASGRVWGSAPHAEFTVTFERMKPGHVLADGPAHCGEVIVAPIGMPDTALAGPCDGAPFHVDHHAVFSRSFDKARAGHKYDHGHAVIASGGQGATGAARLAARSALRVGAGLVTVAAPQTAIPECASQLTAVMLKPVDDAAAFGALLQDSRLNAVALGPGLAQGAFAETDLEAGERRARRMVEMALDSRAFQLGERTLVLDADALTAFADSPDLLFEKAAAGQVILTPHLGEFRRLFPDLAEAICSPPTSATRPVSKVEVARQAARRSGAVILLKGADTVIAAPSGEVAVSAAAYARAAPWLATAGSGDVLTGLIAGLAARGFSAFEAAAAGAYLHVEAAREFGPALIAEDLPEALPAVFRRLFA